MRAPRVARVLERLQDHAGRRPRRRRSRRGPRRRGARPSSARRCGWTCAFIWQKPAMVSGMMMASAPPAIITSASPRWMILHRVADGVVAGGAGGDHRRSSAPWRRSASRPGPDAMLMMSIGMKKGETRSGPFSSSVLCLSRMVLMPPIPEPTRTPKRAPSTVSDVEARVLAPPSTAQATAYWRKGSSFRSSFLSMYLSGSKPLHLARDARGIAGGVEARDGPDARTCPAISAAQNSSAVLPDRA